MKEITFCVSMSTIPSRIENINDILHNINNQTLKPNKIFLNIPYEYRRFKNSNISETEIQKINKENIEITRCNDYGPGTKIMGSLSKIKNYDFVILLDDDHLYDRNICKIFMDAFKIKAVNYSFYLNKIFNIKMGQCADGFLINTELLDDIEKFYNTYVKENYNMFMDDDLWMAIYLQKEKLSSIDNLIGDFQQKTKKNIVYEQNKNSQIQGLHLTVHKKGFLLNRRKIQKIEYIKYILRKFFIKIRLI